MSRPRPTDTQSAAEAPVDLWDENGEVLWLCSDLASSGERAKRIAFVGHDPTRRVVLPETFLGGVRWGYDDLDVTLAPVPLRPGDPGEHGWAGEGADTWYRCEPDHPGAVTYWQVTC